jgi:hypothetical protein
VLVARADEDGFRPLFNGRDLTGWTYNGQPLDGKTQTPDGRFLVVDGTIVAAEGKGIKVLNTAANYDDDFVFRLEFRASLKSDSGVYVRGPQLQVRDFIRRNEHMHLKNVFKNDDWNALEITVNGRQIVTTVNGKVLKPTDALEVTVKDGRHTAVLNGKEVDLGSITMSRGATVCKINGVEFDPTYRAGAKGPIGLQAETGKFEFRNVRIRDLPRGK